jgi:hypothetical protein
MPTSTARPENPSAPAPGLRSAWRLLLGIAAILWSGVALADDYERWYRIELAGQHAGYMHSSRRTADERIISTSHTSFTIGRGAATVSISMESMFVERISGEPVSMTRVERLGNLPTTTEYTFKGGELHIRSSQADQVTDSVRPLPEGAWLTPAATESYLRQRLAAGADHIIVRTIDPLSGPDPQTYTRSGIMRETIEVLGNPVEVFRCSTVSTAAPGVESVEYLDARGVPVRLTTQMMGIPFVVTLAERGAAVAVGGQLPPELMARTFIKPSRRIRSPRTTTRAEYVLSLADGEMPPLPATGVQRVERLDDRRYRVVVDTTSPQPADAAAAADAGFLEASSMLNTQDPRIIELVGRATAKAGDGKAARAEAMRRFVYGYIRDKDLDVGFATASEVARSRRGDCTEHGVLLAAMLRADGIPSRVVSGLIYADRFAGEQHIFGYHLWTQALLEIEEGSVWVDLDSTLPEAHFDATHIALMLSPLRDGETVTSLSAMVPIIGRLEINIESIK